MYSFSSQRLREKAAASAPSAALALLYVVAYACLPGAAYAQTGRSTRRPAAARDSFLYPPANSTGELVRAVEKDRALRLRYARHFGLSEDQVVNFIRRSLIVYTLPEARTVTTYGVTRTGRIYPVRERLKKGTRVWATHSGTPVLKWACANPLTTRLPGTKFAKGPRYAPAPSPARPAPPPPVLVEVAPSNELPPRPEEGALVPVPPPVIVATGGPVPIPLPLGGGGRVAVAPRPRGGAEWFFPLIGLPFFFGGGGGDDSGTDTSPPSVLPPAPTPPNPGAPVPVPPPVDQPPVEQPPVDQPPGGGIPELPPPPEVPGAGNPPGGELPPGGGTPPGGGIPPGEVPPIPEPGPVAVFGTAALWVAGWAAVSRRRRQG